MLNMHTGKRPDNNNVGGWVFGKIFVPGVLSI
jgi:hypothetical protein